mmetsp:Transcript_20692/g.19716  ORF Transcript_20692/g.19716 Transcript_20692/m.19716 type:complete len:203 (+) Transcript_20692:1833-2441(+)
MDGGVGDDDLEGVGLVRQELLRDRLLRPHHPRLLLDHIPMIHNDLALEVQVSFFDFLLEEDKVRGGGQGDAPVEAGVVVLDSLEGEVHEGQHHERGSDVLVAEEEVPAQEGGARSEQVAREVHPEGVDWHQSVECGHCLDLVVMSLHVLVGPLDLFVVALHLLPLLLQLLLHLMPSKVVKRVCKIPTIVELGCWLDILRKHL